MGIKMRFFGDMRDAPNFAQFYPVKNLYVIDFSKPAGAIYRPRVPMVGNYSIGGLRLGKRTEINIKVSR